jgi:hypothetical protein
MPSFLHFYSQKHHDKEEQQQGQQQQQQQKDDGEKEEAREARDDGPNDTGVGDVHRGTKEEEKKRAYQNAKREREPPKNQIGKQRDEDEDEVVLVVFVSSGFFLSFFLCVSDSVAACIFFLRLIRFHARLSLFIYLSLTKMRSFFSFVASLQKCAGNETGIRFEPAGSSASKVLRK